MFLIEHMFGKEYDTMTELEFIRTSINIELFTWTAFTQPNSLILLKKMF